MPNIDTAVVLAAGLGKRMRPLTDLRPKPLVELAGRTLLDRVLDRLVAAGIERVVVNVHYLADQIEAHLAARPVPAIAISDERGLLLDTGGGVVRAVGLAATTAPVIVHNSDSVWLEPADTGHGTANITSLLAAWRPEAMDCLMLLADRERCLGYSGPGDFQLAPDGRLSRPARGAGAPFVFAGVSIASARLLRDAPQGAFSLNRLWDRAQIEGRLFGIVLDGTWMHVGDPLALQHAEAFLAAHDGKNGGQGA
jgi:MurNAc alpha-1-phosphate uridylyltransferase